MSTPEILLLVMAAILIPLAGFLAAADSAISTVSAARVAELEREDHRGAKSLAQIVADRARYINLLLMLRLAAEISAIVTVAAVAFNYWGFRTIIAVTVAVVMLLISYIAIGVLPRTLGRQHPYAVGLASAKIARLLGVVFAPLSRLLIAFGNAIIPGRGFRSGPFTTDVELRELVDMASDRGVVLESERDMLQSVFDLSDTIVREVMVPRTEVVWIEANKTLRHAVHLANRSGFSRIPVIGQGVDDVIGVVYVKDLIARLLSLPADDKGPTVAELMRTSVFVPESKAVDQLLREMQRDRTHLAIVVDEYGGMAGIITMEDIVEEIVGEITDEYDADTPDPITALENDTYQLSARLPVEDFAELFGIDLATDDVETVGGLLAQLLGRVALPGSQVDIDGVRLVAEGGVDRRGRQRVVTLRAWRLGTDESEDQPTTATEPQLSSAATAAYDAED